MIDFPEIMHSRSRAAFLLSVDKLFKERPKVYFWTFTWRHVHNDRDYSGLWLNFIRNLEKALWREAGRPGVPPGLIVVEVHPGGHGLHYHVLWGGYVDINLVRRLAEPQDMFWIQVKECWSSGVGLYLAKYLSKGGDELGTRMRRWRSFGGFRHCRCSDVEFNTPYTRERNLVLDMYRGRHPAFKMPYQSEIVLWRCWLRCSSFADFASAAFVLFKGDWDAAKRMAILSSVKVGESMEVVNV